jgi:hypothetical protein
LEAGDDTPSPPQAARASNDDNVAASANLANG